MAKKIILEDSQGNVLHPKTLGECVTTETGETVDGLVSKTQMFSPIIETDSSMSKVGVGTDLDVSLNVKDGAYEECVFEGRSLVNLMTSCKDETLIEYCSPPADSNVANVSMIKPNTVYTIIYSAKYQEEGNIGHLIIRTQQNGGDINVSSGFTFDTTYKRFAYKFTTPSTIDYFVLRSNGHYFHVKEVMLLEGDYTNVSIPYFEGLCDSKMPILRNVGKNLLTREYALNSATLVEETNEYVMTKGSGNIAGGLVFAPNLIPNKTYSFSVTAKTNRTDDGAIRIYNDTRKEYINVYLAGLTTQAQKVGGVFTVPSTHQMGDEFKIWIGKNIAYDLETTFTIYKDWQLEESSSITTHEDHKTNILRTSEEIVLREVSGIQDTYNPLTGEYTKRIGEITFNGSENEWEDWNENSFVLRGSYFSDAIEHSSSTAPRLKCNNMVAGLGETPRAVRYYKSPTVLWTMVGKNDGETLDQFKQWLSQNPATIQYILAEPVTTIVKPSTIPFAYANGHMVLESGSSEQSLLPHLKYSVVTGRTGQVTQNAKVLRQQENQITSLEDLLLTQIVQMDYERTLLQFDFELQAMMLG